MPICGGWAFLCKPIHSQTSVRPLVHMIPLKLAFPHHLPSLLALPSQQKPASKVDHIVIQSSRLHHWLPLSQVPKCTGRSSEPLLSRGLVCGDINSDGANVLYPRALCILKNIT